METPTPDHLAEAPSAVALAGVPVKDSRGRIGRVVEYRPGATHAVIRHLTVPGIEWTAPASEIWPVEP
jgi:hypothetical protein